MRRAATPGDDEIAGLFRQFQSSVIFSLQKARKSICPFSWSLAPYRFLTERPFPAVHLIVGLLKIHGKECSMWRHTKQSMILAGLSLVVWMVPMSVPVWAGVDVNINIGVPLPPAIVVEAPPAMVFLAEPGVYVAVGVPYDIFFIGGRYYYLHGGYWYWGPGYGGPWVHVVDRSLPPGLRRYKVDRLHEFREREFRRYTAEGPKYRGRHFNAVAGPGPKVRDEMKGGPTGPGQGRHERGGGKHDR